MFYYFLLFRIGFDKFRGNLEYPLFDLGGRGLLLLLLLLLSSSNPELLLYFNDYFNI